MHLQLSITFVTVAWITTSVCAGGYEQPYGFDSDPGSHSSIDGLQIADEFIYPHTTEFADVFWYGSFDSGSPFKAEEIMQFTIRWFNDAGGVPDTVPRLEDSFVFALAMPTTYRTSDGHVVYEFLAMDVDAEIPADQLQYVSIMENDDRFGPNDFRWSNSTYEENDLNWSRSEDAGEWNPFGPFRGQAAFRIGEPVPSPAALPVFLSLLVYRSRSRGRLAGIEQ